LTSLSGEQTQDLENALFSQMAMYNIDNGFGDMLDVIGEIVNQPRSGQDDATYKIFLKAKVGFNSSAGTYVDLFQVWSIFANSTSVWIEELYPRQLKLFALPDSLPVGLESAILEFMDAAAPGGIRVTTIAPLATEGDGFFKFGSSADGFDLGVWADPIATR